MFINFFKNNNLIFKCYICLIFILNISIILKFFAYHIYSKNQNINNFVNFKSLNDIDKLVFLEDDELIENYDNLFLSKLKSILQIIENPIIFDYQINQSKIFFSKNNNYNIFKKQIIKRIFKNPETNSNKLFIIVKKKLIKNNVSKKKINEIIYCLIKINF
jgi:hypothetical protein